MQLIFALGIVLRILILSYDVCSIFYEGDRPTHGEARDRYYAMIDGDAYPSNICLGGCLGDVSAKWKW